MQRQGKLLIVDDEAVALANLERVMSKAGYGVTAVQSGEEALALLETQAFDVLLTDLRMEKVDGMRLLKVCRTRHPDCEVIMITGYASAQSAVEAMKQGAFYYITKPFRLDEVRKVVAEAMEKIRLRNENRSLKQQVEVLQGQVRIVTQDSGMLRLLELARQVAPTDCSVLIVGESGTGKELFARYLHQHSGRHAGPYVAVNCGAFSKDLLANELFGHEKDAFTGARTQKKGLIEKRIRRHAVPGRSDRDVARDAGQIAARHPGKRSARVSVRPSRSRSTSASLRRPTAIWRKRCAAACCARTCISVSTW